MSSNYIKKQKCFECNCKINQIDTIIGKCRCNNIFCIKHKQSHNCSYDYIKDYKDNNNLIKLESSSFEKI